MGKDMSEDTPYSPQGAEDFVAVPVNGDPLLSQIEEAHIDALAQALIDKPAIITESLYTKFLSTEVAFPNGTSGVVIDLLQDEESALAAIDGAIQANLAYQETIVEFVGKGKGDNNGVDQRKPDLLANLGILRRVKEGKYNGSAIDLERQAMWNLGMELATANYIQHEVAPTVSTNIFTAGIGKK